MGDSLRRVRRADWRVLEMNPLLAQLLALLYRVAPRVPWYGLTMAVLLSGACARDDQPVRAKARGLFPRRSRRARFARAEPVDDQHDGLRLRALPPVSC